MVNNNDAQLNSLFSALSDPTRRQMLKTLARQEVSVAELSKPFDMTKSAITKHVKILESVGLLNRTVQGRVHLCKLNPKPLAEVSQWVQYYEQFWNIKLDSLERYLNKEKN